MADNQSFLDTVTYDALEKEAFSELPMRVKQIAQPAAFDKTGIPTRAIDQASIGSYADCMSVNEGQKIIEKILVDLTDEEWHLFKSICDRTAAFSATSFGREIIPWEDLSRALHLFRHIKLLYPEPCSIFEIGPGSGYLGILLHEAGYTYAATDITQGFYLYQNQLGNHFAKDKYVEYALQKNHDFENFDLSSNMMAHIPWWHYLTLYKNLDALPKFDLVISNAILCEMSELSRRYFFKLTKHMVKSDNWHNGIAFQCWGQEGVGTRDSVARGLMFNGFTPTVHTPYFYLFSESEKANTGDIRQLFPMGCDPDVQIDLFMKTKDGKSQAYFDALDTHKTQRNLPAAEVLSQLKSVYGSKLFGENNSLFKFLEIGNTF